MTRPMDETLFLRYGDGTTTEVKLWSAVKIVPCKYRCGGLFVVTSRLEREPHHLLCGITAMCANMKQLHEKQGPFYDKWLSRYTAWRRLVACDSDSDHEP